MSSKLSRMIFLIRDEGSQIKKYKENIFMTRKFVMVILRWVLNLSQISLQKGQTYFSMRRISCFENNLAQQFLMSSL